MTFFKKLHLSPPIFVGQGVSLSPYQANARKCVFYCIHS